MGSPQSPQSPLSASDRYSALIARASNLLILCVLAEDAADQHDYLSKAQACLLRAAALGDEVIEAAIARALIQARRSLFKNVLPRLDGESRAEVAAAFRRAEDSLVVRPTIH